MMEIPFIPIQNIYAEKVSVDLLREDLNHEFISGNKLRKLKYNLLAAREEGQDTLLTFGGAYSNHIYAVAATGKAFGYKTIGVIRGEELQGKPLNPTLQFATSCGMQLHFVSRQKYREKHTATFVDELKQKLGRFYLLPEGGTNHLAVKGCEEILDERTKTYDFICCAVGTAGTLSGILEASQAGQNILGFLALKNADYLHETVKKYSDKTNYHFVNAYHFGGYGKISPELLSFVQEFEKTHQIPLEPIYTGKMIYGIFDLIQKKYFSPGSKILAVHTGGLQGNRGIAYSNNNK